MAPGLKAQPLPPRRAQSTTRLLLTAGRSSKKPWKETGRQGGPGRAAWGGGQAAGGR